MFQVEKELQIILGVKMNPGVLRKEQMWNWKYATPTEVIVAADAEEIKHGIHQWSGWIDLRPSTMDKNMPVKTFNDFLT